MSNLYLIHERTRDHEYEKIVSIVQRKIDDHTPKTRATYQSTWNIFLEWYNAYGNKRSLLSFTPLDASDFFKWAKQRKGVGARIQRECTWTPTTSKRFAAALKTFWKVIFQEYRVVQFNPFEPELKKYGRGLRSERRPTEVIPFDKVIELVEAPDSNRGRGLRDRAILACLAGGGLRRDEPTGLNCCDILIRENYIELRIFNTKNGDDILHRVNGVFSKYILEYAAYRRQFMQSESEPFFIDFAGYRDVPQIRRYSDSAIYAMVKAYAKQIGLPTSISPHSLRKTGINYLIMQDIKTADVAIWSRHSSLDMLQKYVDKLREPERNPYAALTFKPK